jgi:hypothetical protein
MAVAINSPEDIIIKSIRMTAERYDVPIFLAGNEIDGADGMGGSPSVIEFNMYESLFKPYITANMVVIDDTDFYRTTDITGVERIIIEFEAPGGEGSVIQKTFVIKAIEESVKTNDFTSILNISLIEDIGYYNALLNINRAYNGIGEVMLFNIIADNFKSRTLDIQSEFLSYGKSFRYIAPNVDPFTAMQHILDKMSTEIGLPFFLYSSIYQDKFVLTDLQTILKKDTMNLVGSELKPFVYSQGQTNIASDDLEAKSLNVMSYEPKRLDSTFDLFSLGALGSKFRTINVTSGKAFNNHINMLDLMQRLIDRGDIPAEQGVIQIDEKFIADPIGEDTRSLVDFEPVHFNLLFNETYPEVRNNAGDIISPGTNSYSNDEFELFLKVYKEHFMSNLLKNVYNIFVPGLLFSFGDHTSVGNQIALNIFKNEIAEKEVNVVDEKKSGYFVILKKRHKFDLQTKGKHTVVLEISRLFNRIES